MRPPLTALFDDPQVRLSSSPVDPLAIDGLTEAERALIARAIDKRKFEFATARQLARALLRELARPAVEILNGEDRAPSWPEGVAGSITHCDTRVLVAMTERARGTVGVDIEHRQGLARELWKTVFSKSEVARLDAHFDDASRGRMALVLFSAKEALYKAQYPITRKFMGFHELEVELVPDGGEAGALRCTFQNDVRAETGHGFAHQDTVLGRYRLDLFDTGEVVSAVHIRPDEVRRR